MSKLRPEGTRASTGNALPDSTALYGIYGAVKGQCVLIHGQLHDGHGAHCAIGSFWTASPKSTPNVSLIDEVAAVNDSVPHLSGQQRRAHVLRWLRWKLKSLGMPGFSAAKQP